ncbi:hypothetical protein E8E13_008618 [Curvularia kusanoi]|uniref:Uncharacterized protein n=1 Tax=Curvularia kusanoi TaxID=90978 RepID=A0A9P4TCA1_CURKU|nr:hypothetical protein E8E13_008618 [Curvularia kusanoi]
MTVVGVGEEDGDTALADAMIEENKPAEEVVSEEVIVDEITLCSGDAAEAVIWGVEITVVDTTLETTNEDVLCAVGDTSEIDVASELGESVDDVLLVEIAAEETEDEIATETRLMEVSVLVTIPDDVLDMVFDTIGVTDEDGSADALTT